MRRGFYGSDSLLLEALKRMACDWEGLTVIVINYEVALRQEEGKLVPILPSIPNQSAYEKGRNDELGDFTTRAWKLALGVHKSAQDSRVMVLVNDVRMRNEFAQGSILPKGNGRSQLFRDYYRRGEIPEEFTGIAQDMLGRQPLFLDNNQKRGGNHTLPPKANFYSENIFRQDSDDRRKRGLRVGTNKPSHQECLITQEGGSKCSAIALEMLYQLCEKGIRNVLLFIPHGCRNQVELAVNAVQDSDKSFEQVVVVWGARPSTTDLEITSF